ncbi:MAG: alpha/beta fold hydrolase [Solirubrobacteraceae bacterium]
MLWRRGRRDDVDYEHLRYRGVDLRSHAVGFLNGLLDALELERASFVANSMGGLSAMWLAIERRKRVSSLALLGAPAMMLGSSAPLALRLLGVAQAQPRRSGRRLIGRVPENENPDRATPGRGDLP